MSEQTEGAEVLPGTWRNHDDPRDEWPSAEDLSLRYVAGMLADAEDEFWTAYHRIAESLGEHAAGALGTSHDAMALRIFTGPEFADAIAAAEARGAERALREAADEAERHKPNGTHVHSFWEAGRWLRARAAARGVEGGAR